MDDYTRISQAISYLVDHAHRQPGLEQLAAQAGWSSAHFQRKFSDWTGVSPKAMLQHLTLDKALDLLASPAPMEEVAWASGLSGPGRLHDLCVKLEAASPGEIRSGGKGLQIRYGFAPTPFGECLIAETGRGICHLAFVSDSDRDAALRELQTLWPQAHYIASPARALELGRLVFNPAPEKEGLRAFVRGTAFQLKVWQALLKIPDGSTTSYGAIAAKIGCPGSARAVGTAVGSNILAYLIPCHRVIRNSGIIGEYRWGSPRKRIMLALERARQIA